MIDDQDRIDTRLLRERLLHYLTARGYRTDEPHDILLVDIMGVMPPSWCRGSEDSAGRRLNRLIRRRLIPLAQGRKARVRLGEPSKTHLYIYRPDGWPAESRSVPS